MTRATLYEYAAKVRVRKVIGKERHGARVRKLYDAPRRPYQRLLESGALSETKARQLEEHSSGPSIPLNYSAASNEPCAPFGLALSGLNE